MRREKRKEVFLFVARGGLLDDLEEGWKKVKQEFLQTEIGKKVDEIFSNPKKEKHLEEKIPADLKYSLTQGVKKTPTNSKDMFKKFFSDPKIFEDEKEKMATHSEGRRDLKKLKWIVIHSTESKSASSTAEYFGSDHATGSAHFVVGEDAVYRTLPDEIEPWGAPGANLEGLHIEVVGYAKFTKEEWLRRRRTLERVKEIVSNWSSKYNIPLEFIDSEDLKAGKSGVTTHAEVSEAFQRSTHWDPGPNFPIEKIL